jgi:hypothetical protein
LRALFRKSLEAETGWVVSPPVHEPAIGAMLEAYRAAGVIPYEIRQPFLER